jgi:hypothetical protein
VILSEIAEARLFVFHPIGPEMMMGEVCDALIARGISAQDAMALMNEAIAEFDRSQRQDRTRNDPVR